MSNKSPCLVSLLHAFGEDYENTNAYKTESVADYGMIVSAYLVGWAFPSAMMAVPQPTFTLSERAIMSGNISG